MEEPVEVIRDCARSALMVNRRAHRDEETDIRRHIVSQNVTKEVIADIANRLKSKSAVSVTELRTLKNELLDNAHYTEVVLNTQGAVRGLVRELTGLEGSKQCIAAGCLCNLALGDPRACVALAKTAGPYLVTALDSFNSELAITCAWALGNAAGSGAKAAELMTSQGAVSKLAALMTSPTDEVRNAAASALVQFAYHMEDDFKQEHSLQILAAFTQKQPTESSIHLLFILSCHDDFNELINEELLQKILEVSTTCMENFDGGSSEFMYVIRTLANIDLNDAIYNVIVGCFSSKVDILKKILIFNNDSVNRSLFWLLGNLFNYCSDSEFFKCLLT